MRKLVCIFAVLCAALAPICAQNNDMVLVEGGTFQMGNSEEKDAPVHTVTVSSFYMSKNKVTLSDWITIMGTRPCDYKAWLVWQNPLPSSQWNQMAAMGVNWYEALIYCNRLSVLEGLEPCYSANGSKDSVTYTRWTPNINEYGYKINCYYFADVECDWSANGYRLPTEAEWEYAARGGKNKSPYKYSGSDDFRAVVNLQRPYKIAQKKANALGIHDMSMGPEWCWDWYSSSYYSSSESVNPHGPKWGENKETYMSFVIDGEHKKNAPCRVLRGGEYEALSTMRNAEHAAVYARSYNNPENYDRSGAEAALFMFRVVRNAQGFSDKKNIVVRRDVEVRITGVPYYYFMTDDYDALRAELASYNCRAPSAGALRENPALAQSVRSKMEELGVCWSITTSNGSGVLHYYTREEGPYFAYLSDLR